MVPYQRQKKIIELIQEKNLILINELLEKIPEVSESTLRRDLKKLENQEKIELLSGGAVKLVDHAVADLPIKTKQMLNTDKKKYIVQLAVQQIETNDLVFIDSGSTCSLLLEELVKLPIRIVTNNPIIFSYSNINASVILVGGSFNSHLSSLRGEITIQNLKTFIFDKSFIGCNGVDNHFGISTPSMEEAKTKQIILQRSKITFVLADSSKFNQVSNVEVCGLDKICLITDKQNAQFTNLKELIS